MTIATLKNIFKFQLYNHIECRVTDLVVLKMNYTHCEVNCVKMLLYVYC